MKYTKEQLEQMSDFEINKALAEKLYGDVVVTRAIESFDAVTIHAGGVPVGCVAYCSSWSDIMPLAVEYDVTYVKGEGAALANLKDINTYEGADYNESFEHESPQRAIACCLLMMELN